MKRLKKSGERRMSITVDFYDRIIFEGLQALAILARKKKGEYLREVLTEHVKERVKK